MKETFLSQTNFALAEYALKLGQREKNAAKVVLNGLHESNQTKEQQSPIRITINSSNPFDLINFAGLMHNIGVDITSTQSKDIKGNETTVTFVPKPYKGTAFLTGIISSREATDQFIKSFLDFDESAIS